MKLAKAVIAALILAALGGYILWQYHTTPGLLSGLSCVLLALGIAFPTEFRQGRHELADGIKELGPALKDAAQKAVDQ